MTARRMLRSWLLFTLAMLAGCGFQLRGEAPLPFASVYIDAAAASPIAALLAENLRLAGKQVLTRPLEAEVRVRIAEEVRAKNILALSGGGKVREYRLEHRLTLSASNTAGVEILAPIRLTANRDFSYSDTQVLAKEGEEALLRRDMEQEVLRQVMRRLAFAKP